MLRIPFISFTELISLAYSIIYSETDTWGSWITRLQNLFINLHFLSRSGGGIITLVNYGRRYDQHESRTTKVPIYIFLIPCHFYLVKKRVRWKFIFCVTMHLLENVHQAKSSFLEEPKVSPTSSPVYAEFVLCSRLSSGSQETTYGIILVRVSVVDL